MPNPKRRHSATRGAKRRTHYKLEMPALSRCRQCSAFHAPHRACPECGYYRGRRVPEAVTVRQTKEQQ